MLDIRYNEVGSGVRPRGLKASSMMTMIVLILTGTQYSLVNYEDNGTLHLMRSERLKHQKQKANNHCKCFDGRESCSFGANNVDVDRQIMPFAYTSTSVRVNICI